MDQYHISFIFALKFVKLNNHTAVHVGYHWPAYCVNSIVFTFCYTSENINLEMWKKSQIGKDCLLELKSTLPLSQEEVLYF